MVWTPDSWGYPRRKITKQLLKEDIRLSRIFFRGYPQLPDLREVSYIKFGWKMKKTSHKTSIWVFCMSCDLFWFSFQLSDPHIHNMVIHNIYSWVPCQNVGEFTGKKSLKLVFLALACFLSCSRNLFQWIHQRPDSETVLASRRKIIFDFTIHKI